ncbi:hypothetical protein ACFY64_15470 [Streptomyces collinus]|uniref:hypothetical protein n=1 Tax=Streptomyces collinus TaxID=42684 RepID=UPI003692BDFB
MTNEQKVGRMHGVPLTERGIDAVRRDPAAGAPPYVNVPWVAGGAPRPMPEDRRATAAFPSGHPLSPSLRGWPAYDTSLLERHQWSPQDGGFAPQALDELIADESRSTASSRPPLTGPVC